MTDTTSAADELRAAAALLREAASHATPGPWRTHDTHLGSAGGHTATVLTDRSDINDTELVAWLPTMSHEPWDEARNAWRNAGWMALMHPGVGLAVARWLESWAGVELSEHGPMPEDAQHALAVARQLLGTNVAEDEPAEQEPVQLRWGLDDVMYGDDDTTTILLSGPDREPYWVELDPERTTALRDVLAGPTVPPAPADRAALRDRIRRAICEASGFTWLVDELMEPDEYGEHADAVLAVLADEAAAGVQPPTTVATKDAPVVAYRDPSNSRVLLCREHGERWQGVVPVTPEDLPDGGICTFGRLSSWACGRDVLATTAATEEPTPAPQCSAGLLPATDTPVDRCVRHGAHDTHVTAAGARWPNTEEPTP